MAQREPRRARVAGEVLPFPWYRRAGLRMGHEMSYGMPPERLHGCDFLERVLKRVAIQPALDLTHGDHAFARIEGRLPRVVDREHRAEVPLVENHVLLTTRPAVAVDHEPLTDRNSSR